MATHPWADIVMEAAPLLTQGAAELLYFRAATAWGSGQTLTIPDGIGGYVDLTKLYKQFKLLQTLKAKYE